MSKLFVDQVDPKTATTLTLGTSGDTISIPTGAGLTVTDEVKTNKISPASGTAFTLGDSGDTFTVPSGATITNSGTATGFGGGKVLQVVQGSFRNGATSTTSGSLVDSGATVAITPSATSSKILVMLNSNTHSGAATSTTAFYDISRAISGGATTAGIIGAAAGSPTTQGLGGDSSSYGVISVQYLDSPSTTSAITYRLMLARWFGSSTVYMGNGATNDWCIALEIDGS